MVRLEMTVDSTTFWKSNSMQRLGFLKDLLIEEADRIHRENSKHYWRPEVMGGHIDHLTRYEQRLLLKAIKAHEVSPDVRSMGGALGLAFAQWGGHSPTWIARLRLPEQMFGNRPCEQIFYCGAFKRRRALELELTPHDFANAIQYYLERDKFRFPSFRSKGG